MERNTTESDANLSQTSQQSQSIALMLAAQMNSLQQQQSTSDSHEDEDDGSSTLTVSSQPVSISSWTSSTSIGSTSTDVRMADRVFDQIEDLLSELMRDPIQHHLHCRILHLSPEGHTGHIFSAVVVVNPPFMKNNSRFY